MASLRRSLFCFLRTSRGAHFNIKGQVLRLRDHCGYGFPGALSAEQIKHGHWMSAGILPSDESKKHAGVFVVYKRFFAKASATATGNKITIGPPEIEEEDKNVVYRGAISDTIKKVKLLSLSTCCLSISLGPAITFLTSPNMNVIVKAGVASVVMILSTSTTAVLHWFASPYVHKLRWQPGSDSFEVEVLTWLATYVTRTIRFSDVRAPETKRPYVTFQADGKYYYIDTEHFQNKVLLARLAPNQQTRSSTTRKNNK